MVAVKNWDRTSEKFDSVLKGKTNEGIILMRYVTVKMFFIKKN